MSGRPDDLPDNVFRRLEIVKFVMSRWLPVIMLAAVVFIAGCSPKGGEMGMRRPPAPVLVTKVVAKTVPEQLQEIGTVQAYSTVSVKSRVEGELIAVHFKEGDYVKKGQLLFTLDPRPFKAALMQAEANLQKDMANAQQAATDERRYAFLLKQHVGSQQQYDQAHATALALEAAVAADRAAIETARLNLSYTQIRSPLDGRTGDLMNHVGDMIKADADTGMVVINQVQPIYVDFYIPEKRLSEVRRYMSEHSLEVDAKIPSLGGKIDDTEHGVLNFINNTVDNTTGQILLKGLFTNENRRLWPGQFVNATLTLTKLPNTLLVPSHAVQSGQNGPFVFVISHDMKAEVRPVVPGGTVGGDTIIERGLKEGETIVTDGQLRLAPGVPVAIKSSLAGGPGTSA